MDTLVTVNQKKEYVKWLVENNRFKNIQCVWILEYLMKDNMRIVKVRFVEDAQKYSSGIVMSTTDSEQKGFEFYHLGMKTESLEDTFAHVKTFLMDKIYIQINYKDREMCERYKQILEEEPSNYRKESELESYARKLLEESIHAGNQKRIMELIDEALEKREDDKVRELSKLIDYSSLESN